MRSCVGEGTNLNLEWYLRPWYQAGRASRPAPSFPSLIELWRGLEGWQAHLMRGRWREEPHGEGGPGW